MYNDGFVYSKKENFLDPEYIPNFLKYNNNNNNKINPEPKKLMK